MSRSKFSSLLFLLVAVSPLLTAQETWIDRTADADIGGVLHDVAWGGGRFVAVGTNTSFGLIHSSTDGVTWTDHTQGANIGGILYGVGYGDGRFVAVGTNSSLGLLATSADGRNWTNYTQSAGVGGVLRDVAYGNGVWVAVGDNSSLGVVATSTNGATWVDRASTANIGGVLHAVTYANGTFVAVGTNGSLVVFATSTDGQSWNVRTNTNAIGGVAYDVTYDGTQFIATGDGTLSASSSVAHVLTSPDGVTWTNRTVASAIGGLGFGAGSGGGATVIVGRTGVSGVIATSANGVDWINRTVSAAAPGDLNGVARGLDRWVAVGTNQVLGVVMTSDASGSSGTPVIFEDEVEVGSFGGSLTLNVQANSGVSWTVTEDSNWITLGGASGTGNGVVTLTVQFNSTPFARSATVSLGSDTVTINQAGIPFNAPILSAYFRSDSEDVRVSWNQVSGAESYQLERRLSPDGLFAPIAAPTIAAGVIHIDDQIENGVAYDYRVRAIAGAVLSPWSDVFTVELPPAIPGGVAATARNASQIEITWNDVLGEQGYLVFRAGSDETFFQQIADLPADEVRYVDSGLTSATTYRYEVESKSNLFGRRSAEASATTGVQTDSIVWGSAQSSSGDYLGVAYGANATVAVGVAGRVTRSTDLSTWTEQGPLFNGALRAIDFAQSQFIAVGDAGAIYRSPDGNTWSEVTSGTSEQLEGLAFAQGLWVAVGKDGALLTSSDGISWTSQTSPATAGFVDVFASAAKFVAIEDSGRIITSDDGLVWRETRVDAPTDSTQPFFWTRTAGAFGGSVYSVVGPNDFKSASPDAEGWGEVVGGNFNYYEAVAFGGDRFVAVGLNGVVGYSTTGSTYLSGGSLELDLAAVTYSSGSFVAVGARGLIAASPNGVNWTPVQEAAGTGSSMTAIASGPSQLVAFGQYDFNSIAVRNDLDGAGWIEGPLEVSNIEFLPAVVDAVYSEGQYVVVGQEGLVLTSPDGQAWTTRRTRDTGVFNDSLRGVAAGQGKLLAVGGADPIIRSSDGGATWAPVENLPNGFVAWDIVFGSRWVSRFTSLYFSDDGETWESGNIMGNTSNVSTLTLGSLGGDPLYVGVGAAFGGSQPQSIVSWDGRNWNVFEASGIDESVQAAVFGGGVFLAVGYRGSMVWASLDGSNWEPAPEGFLPEEVALYGGLRDVAYFGGRFYGVGFDGLIVELEISSSAVPPGPVLEPAALQVVQTASSFSLSWPSTFGLRYQVYARSDLTSGTWIPLSSVFEGTGGILRYDTSVPNGETTWFWAVVTSAP